MARVPDAHRAIVRSLVTWFVGCDFMVGVMVV